MRKYWFWGALLALLLAFSAGLSFHSEYGAGRRLVVLGAAEDLINSLVWVAQARGFFREQGVEVRVKVYPSGKRALSGMLRNEVDIATTSGVPFLKALKRHPDLRLLATIGSADDEVKVVSRTDRGISRAEDLLGKTVATQRNSAVDFFLSSFLLQHMIPETGVDIRFMAAEALPGALADGDIDAFSMREPYISRARELLQGEVNVFSAPGLYRKTFNLVALQSYISGHRAALVRVIRGLLQAERYVLRQPVRAQEIIARGRGLTRGDVAEAWDGFNFSVLLDQGLLLQMQQEEHWLERRTGSPVRLRPLSDYLYLDALAEAAPKRVGIIQAP